MTDLRGMVVVKSEQLMKEMFLIPDLSKGGIPAGKLVIFVAKGRTAGSKVQ